MGDPEFVTRAQKVRCSQAQSGTSPRAVRMRSALRWSSNPRWKSLVASISGLNSFLTCSAAPIFDPRGRSGGAIDISGDYRTYQRHTRPGSTSAQLLEKRLFESEYARELQLSFHPRPEHVQHAGGFAGGYPVMVACWASTRSHSIFSGCAETI